MQISAQSKLKQKPLHLNCWQGSRIATCALGAVKLLIAFKNYARQRFVVNARV